VGIFYSVRGWLEMDDVQYDRLKDAILNETDEQLIHYVASWHFPDRGGGYSRFAFFGCTVRDIDLTDIKQQLQRLTLEVTSDDDDLIDYMEGLFHSTHEDGSREIIWRLDKGQLHEQVCAPPSPQTLANIN
jgi:hypothetical protein